MDTIFSELQSALLAGSILSSITSLLLAYFGGVLSSFTPCIYPIIPITVGFIGGSKERTIKDGLLLSTCYVLGMALVYTVLGVLAGLWGRIFGTLTNTTGWYLTVGLVMTVSALWMMDVFHFDPNIWIQRLFKRRKQVAHSTTHPAETTMAGAFFLGITSGFIAAPCTTPVLTTILTFIATQRSVVYGSLLMFFFAIGLGTILVVIGTFATALKILPKSGKWLTKVKVVSGLIILALGEYFIFKAGALQ